MDTSKLAKEMIERVRTRIETEPFMVMLTKMEWAQIIGLCKHAYDAGLTDLDDIRFQTARKLQAQLGIED